MKTKQLPEQRFHWLSGDLNWQDYGGKWIRQVGEHRYHVIELTNMPDACGKDATYTYDVCLSEIDLDALSTEAKQSALSSWGIETNAGLYQRDDSVWSPVDDYEPERALVEMLHSYGAKAPLWQDGGNAYAPLLAAARRESRALDEPAAHAKAMQRRVNRLGSTAQEFMRGDLQSALLRGLAEGSKEARLIGKMHGLKDEDMESVKGDRNLARLGLDEEQED